MQTNIISGYILVAFWLSAVSATSAQNDFNFNDLNPKDVEVQRSDSFQQPAELPPLQPAGLSRPKAQPSILDNDLRSKGNGPIQTTPGTPSSFSAQPKPPSPNAANTAQGTFNQATSQNPMQALNPSRLPLMPNQKSAQQNTWPLSSNSSASSIPTTEPSTRRSIMTPTTGKNEDSRIIVAAGFENEDRINNTPTRGPAKKQDIKSLIAEYSVANTQQPLPGVPKSLEELLNTTDTNGRLGMVQQYWETYFDWATLQNRQRYANWLNQIRSPRSQTDQLLLQTARSMAKNETLAAEIQLARSQSRLQEISGSNPDEMLPLPANDPVTSKYITHYEWYATRQMVPPKLKGINEMLPRTYQLLSQRAETVGQAEQARNLAVSAYSTGQTGMTAVLETGRSWQSSLHSLVATAVSYNKAISDYALTITPAQKPIADIASMLIPKPKAVSAADLPIQPAQANVADKRYSNRRTRQAAGGNAVGPNAGPFRRPTATQQPAISPTQNQYNNNLQPDASAKSPNNTSGMGSRLGGQPKGLGTQNIQQQNTPKQQPSGNGQTFRGGGGGAFGG